MHIVESPGIRRIALDGRRSANVNAAWRRFRRVRTFAVAVRSVAVERLAKAEGRRCARATRVLPLRFRRKTESHALGRIAFGVQAPNEVITVVPRNASHGKVAPLFPRRIDARYT